MNTPLSVRKRGTSSVEEFLAFIAARPGEERWQPKMSRFRRAGPEPGRARRPCSPVPR